MERDVVELKHQLANGPMDTRLDPEEIDELEELGFVVSIDWDDPVGDDGKRDCTVSNPVN